MKKLAVVVLALVLLVGCATPLQITPNTTSCESLFGEIYRLCPTNRINGPLDGAYESFSYTAWTRWLPASKMKSRTNAWDCDDYALELMVEARRLYRTFGTSDTTPAIGIAVGKIEKPGFLGMRTTGHHAVNIIHVKNQGWMFYEPQMRRTALIREALREKMFTIHWILF